MKRLPIFIPLVVSLFGMSLSSHSLDKQLITYKQTQYTPIFDNDGVFPKDSIDFNSSTFTELTYSSPSDKEFSIEVSALLNADNEVDQMKALFNWGGTVIVASQGTIKGSFKQTDKARFPGNQDPDALFQTLLPNESDFEGESSFLGLGWEMHGDRIVGLGYQKTVSPVLLSVDTFQSYEFGFNNRTGEFENYHPEGTYPWKAVDAEGTIETYGLWVRLDPLSKAFEKVARTRRSDSGFFFSADIMTGIAVYTPGERVEDDYAEATEAVATSVGQPGEGTTLEVAEATSLLTSRLVYGTGYQMVFPVSSAIVGASLGVEGSLHVNLFESDYAGGSGAEAEIFTESSNFGYGFFFRLGVAY